ncbi:polysaccharide lyase [Arsukibacterium indicum]|uniref:Polysaccharide lyase 14 domain-containing protein n=1 Tax=Arsukibacterium indicum TaxID=2848612 RepID=A0ABS6MFY0_9GAMM|nr:hypothetical protein [Arsukibacterium indicum]MBV2127704.1 hypothetical protein [Arsukibacterium indicum]
MLSQNWIIKFASLLAFCLLPLSAVSASSSPDQKFVAVDWQEGDKKNEGASRSFSYAAAYISWPGEQMGAWVDANMEFMGEQPFARQQISHARKDQVISWQVTELVQQIIAAGHPAIDLVLRGIDSDGTSNFHSKESDNNKAATLIITTSAGKTLQTTAAMDSFLDSSTFRSLGQSKNLKAGSKNIGLLRFNMPALNSGEQVTKATLELTIKKQFGSSDIGVFWLAKPATNTSELKAFLPRQLIFTEQFSDNNWLANWSSLDRRSNAERVQAPLRPNNYALKVQFNPEQNLALNLVLMLKSILSDEPEALYFQYDLFLADNWLATKGGGKFPGLAGTYNTAGWGGRSADGTNGWSARGQFGDTIVSTDKYDKSTPLGFYAYYPDNGQNHGAAMYWDSSNKPIKPGKWYRITQYVKLNTPGKADGVLTAWVDQQQVFQRKNIRFRDTSNLKIERLWLNFYHGGTAKPVQLMELYIDNIVLATE